METGVFDFHCATNRRWTRYLIFTVQLIADGLGYLTFTVPLIEDGLGYLTFTVQLIEDGL